MISTKRQGKCGRVNRVLRPLATVIMFGLLTPLTHASEGGSRNVKPGAFTLAPAVFPAPGKSAFVGYFAWFRGNSLRDNGGHQAGSFHTDYFGHAGRFVHTWNIDWNGFHISSTANYLVAYVHARLDGVSDHDADLTAFNVEPIILNKTFRNETLGVLKWMAGVSYWYPVGHYEPRGNSDPPPHGAPNPHFLANAVIHANYATIVPETAITWRPIPTLQIDSDTYMGLNFTNHRTGYRSGDKVVEDLGITSWPFTGLPRLGVGVGGYYLYQFQEDHVDGKVYPGHKLTQIAVGPQAIYTLPSHTALIFKWQHDVRTDNAANGDLFWLLFFVPVRL